MGTTYTQLSITERRRIERGRHAKVPVDEIAGSEALQVDNLSRVEAQSFLG
jgi:IS30 family transposase